MGRLKLSSARAKSNSSRIAILVTGLATPTWPSGIECSVSEQCIALTVDVIGEAVQFGVDDVVFIVTWRWRHQDGGRRLRGVLDVVLRRRHDNAAVAERDAVNQTVWDSNDHVTTTTHSDIHASPWRPVVKVVVYCMGGEGPRTWRHRQRRQERNALGVEGVGNEEGVFPSPFHPGEWAPPAGYGAERRPKMNSVYFIYHSTLLVEGKSKHCAYPVCELA